METGYLKIITTNDGAPIQATITVLNKNTILYDLQTNENGSMDAVELEAPPIELSLDQKYMDAPYSTYDVKAEALGFTTIYIYDVMVFDGELSILPINMPTSVEYEDTHGYLTTTAPKVSESIEYHIPAHQLTNMDGRRIEASIPQHKLLPEIKIPEFITIHMGHPDSPASNICIPFIDYIKNSASHEIYPTWPSAALEANIYCIISLALNRVLTKSYRAKRNDFDVASGYDAYYHDFDITNNPMFDPIYVKGGQIFRSIDVMVDSIFNRFIKREGYQEPFFAKYSDGRHSTCPGLWQWGTVGLALRGLNALEILRHYYPGDIQVVETDNISGIEKPFPGYPLCEGMSCCHVWDLQVMLNRIAVNFPAIPTIDPVTGVYGPETVATVKAFMHISGIEPDAAGDTIDRKIWNRISFAFSAIRRQNNDKPNLNEAISPCIENIPANQLLTMFFVSQALKRG